MEQQTLTTAPSATKVREVLVVVLALTSGATDAIGFLALGSAFTSVMTGNMVLFGIGVAHGDTAILALTATAIGSFVLGAAVGARVAGNPEAGDPVWPAAVSRALMLELGLFTVFAAAWWALGSSPPEGAFLPLLALNAVALGLQSSAIQRFGVSGLSTTYLTGTLTSVMIRLVSGHGFRAVGHSLAILLGLVAGAALGAALVTGAPGLVPVVQLGTLTAVILGRRAFRHVLAT
ncbi:MAG: DUF1275 domain-containing protein [Micrococcales bacterium]|nr:DUF1275 domain-containing protein [Micrococcales bacterium]